MAAEDKTKAAWKSLIAGAISGCVAKTMTAPLDRVKILFQGYSPHYSHHAGVRFGVFKAAHQIFDSHGLRGLFQGHSAMLLRIMPSAAIRFMAYEQFKALLIPTSDKNTSWRHFLAGSLAGNVAVLFTYPFEVIRSRLAFEIRHPDPSYPKLHGIVPTVQLIYLENDRSLRGFYKGFGPTMYGIVPYAGAAFMTYQSMKRWFLTLPADSLLKPYTTKHATRHPDQLELRVPIHLFIGGMAGMFGQTVSYPFDTIRHQMQLYGVARNIPLYESTAHAIKVIWTKEGPRGFFRGLSINYWKTMPANAVAFVVYDAVMKQLD